MSKETFALIFNNNKLQDSKLQGKKCDTSCIYFKNVEMQFLMQCSPVIAGLKASNLLIVPKGSLMMVKKLTENKRFSYHLLLKKDFKETYLIFDSKRLMAHLYCKRTRMLLKKIGYENFQLEQLLDAFGKRYQAYQNQAEIFPHEMGVFLEYPIEDVEGFIFHQGRNYILNGYWKVYHAPDSKKRLFEEFEYAQEQICKLYLSGINAEQILTHYSKNNTKSIY